MARSLPREMRAFGAAAGAVGFLGFVMLANGAPSAPTVTAPSAPTATAPASPTTAAPAVPTTAAPAPPKTPAAAAPAAPQAPSPPAPKVAPSATPTVRSVPATPAPKATAAPATTTAPTAPATPAKPAPAAQDGAVKESAAPATNGPKAAADLASPPTTLNMKAFREEVSRSPAQRVKKERTDLDDSVEAVIKARGDLRKDTARLEELLRKVVLAKGKPVDESSAEWDVALAGTPVGGPPVKQPLDVLAKAMRGMRPEQAAPIVSHLARALAADLLQRMPPADAGPILGQMKPEVAAEIAAEIAARQPKPHPPETKAKK